MRWYEKLYVGEKAKKHRYETIQAVRNGRPMGFYVLTPAAGERNLLDIYPGRIICEVYKKTGGYDVNSFLFGKGCCE